MYMEDLTELSKEIKSYYEDRKPVPLNLIEKYNDCLNKMYENGKD